MTAMEHLVFLPWFPVPAAFLHHEAPNLTLGGKELKQCVCISQFFFFCSRNLLVQSNLAMKSPNLQRENHIEAKAKSLPLPGCQVGYKKSRIGFECFR